MSKSAAVALGCGMVLVGALGVIVGRDWAHLHDAWGLVLVGLTLYVAATSAVLIRRIVDPKLNIPALAMIVWVIFWIMEVIDDLTDTKGSYREQRYRHRRTMDDTPGQTKGGMGVFAAVVATIFSLAAYGGGIALIRYVAKERHGVPAHPVAATTPTPAPTPAPAPAPTPPAAPPPPSIADAPDLATAIARAKPDMTDDHRSLSKGARELAIWLATKGKWADLAVGKNETSPALVEKDPVKEIGKRMCVAGGLASIERHDVDGTPAYTAQLETDAHDRLQMIVVGDTGALVKQSRAKFCGVVGGRLDINTMPETFAVGMLKAN